MNIKRAIGFGVFMWVSIFIIISVLMFTPFLVDRQMTQNVIYWILLIPLTLILAKWYFRVDVPTAKKGLYLALIGILVGTILDLIITIPFFVGGEVGFMEGLKLFYYDWQLYIGFIIAILTCTYAGFEFDATFTKMSGSGKVGEEKEEKD